jgi:ATP-dependent Lhr-like helicase
MKEERGPVLERLFHPLTAAWFIRRLGTPHPVQDAAWTAIAEGRNCLVMAPTGSGKTLAAFLVAVDRLVKQGLEAGLDPGCRVLYISPLRALAADIRENLEPVCAGVAEAARTRGTEDFRIRLGLRTGDTPAAERRHLAGRPPHVLLTTPESFYLMLSSPSGRRLLGGIEIIILDEVHAWIETKRGAHLLLSLERLETLTKRPPQRIALSATVQPAAPVARAVSGGGAPATIVDSGSLRPMDCVIELPVELGAGVLSTASWERLHDRIVELASPVRTTLVFANTRRLAERTARRLSERLPAGTVACHHGSLSREIREDVERRFRSGEIRILVATASLELGIDLGHIDLVCQLGSTHRIHTFVQRVGRSGHGPGRLPSGRLFPLSRQDLAECAALLAAVSTRRLENLGIAPGALDVLAQQVIAEVSTGDCGDRELYARFSRAAPYRDLSWETFTTLLQTLSQGYTRRSGYRRDALIRWDRIGGRVAARPGARLAVWLNPGVLPETFDLEVRLLPADERIGTINEDFAFESSVGDVFQLGNASYRMVGVHHSRVEVTAAPGATPNIPFWTGEAPGRSRELSQVLAELEEAAGQALDRGNSPERGLREIPGLGLRAAGVLAQYWQEAHAAFGALPGPTTILAERFFDEVGDLHLVIHAPWGSRINRAWGWALRKRFCRQFNFELQAAALEDSLVLSLGPVQSFELDTLPGYLHAATAREVLTQAILGTPLFQTRWRWVATNALAVTRRGSRGLRPPQFQRSEAEDLLVRLFPDALACPENLAGQVAIPDHPLVDQALADCLEEALDATGWIERLAGIESGAIRWVFREAAHPSVLAQEILAARPYAFLDAAPGEERRTRNVGRGDLNGDLPVSAGVDGEVVRRFAESLLPVVASADALAQELGDRGLVTTDQIRVWSGRTEADLGELMDELVDEGQAVRAFLGTQEFWVATERLAEFRVWRPDLRCEPAVPAPCTVAPCGVSEKVDADAACELLRSHFEFSPPQTATTLARLWGLEPSDIEPHLRRLGDEGILMSGRYLKDEVSGESQWVDRRLLARLLREGAQTRRIGRPARSLRDFVRFLFLWQGIGGEEPQPAGREAVVMALDRLEGYPIPAPALERELLPLRVNGATAPFLDELMTEGGLQALRDREVRRDGRPGSLKVLPFRWIPHEHLGSWLRLVHGPATGTMPEMGHAARELIAWLRESGPAFESDLAAACGLLPAVRDQALAELLALGLIGADRYGAMRRLWMPRPWHLRPSGRIVQRFRGGGGRWFAWPEPAPASRREEEEDLGILARALLRRYGIVFSTLVARELGPLRWQPLLRFYRRLEAQEEIHTGRFIEGFSGEQFAVPEALGLLEKATRPAPALVTVAAADPLNLTGSLVPGPRLPAWPGNRLLWCDGELLAVLAARKAEFRVEPKGLEGSLWCQALRRSGMHPAPSRVETIRRESKVIPEPRPPPEAGGS